MYFSSQYWNNLFNIFQLICCNHFQYFQLLTRCVVCIIYSTLLLLLLCVYLHHSLLGPGGRNLIPDTRGYWTHHDSTCCDSSIHNGECGVLEENPLLIKNTRFWNSCRTVRLLLETMQEWIQSEILRADISGKITII